MPCAGPGQNAAGVAFAGRVFITNCLDPVVRCSAGASTGGRAIRWPVPNFGCVGYAAVGLAVPLSSARTQARSTNRISARQSV